MSKYTYEQIATDPELFQEYFGGKEDVSDVFESYTEQEKFEMLEHAFGPEFDESDESEFDELKY